MLGGLWYVRIALVFLVFGGVDLWFVIVFVVLFALVGGRS